MVQTIAANTATLRDLRQLLGLEQSFDPDFFPEWRQPKTALSEAEQQQLDRAKANFTALLENPPMLEHSVKMVVLSPLLDLAKFYRQPFRLKTKASIDLELEDDGLVIRGRIDVMALKEQFWLVAIESKRNEVAVARAIPQVLAHMLSNPNEAQSTFGLITNGREFLFLKVTRQPAVQYANSRMFSLLSADNELYSVLQMLKQWGAKVQGTKG